MGIFLLWATSGRFKKSWRYVILIKFGQYINEMMAVAVDNFQNF